MARAQSADIGNLMDAAIYTARDDDLPQHSAPRAGRSHTSASGRKRIIRWQGLPRDHRGDVLGIGSLGGHHFLLGAVMATVTKTPVTWYLEHLLCECGGELKNERVLTSYPPRSE